MAVEETKKRYELNLETTEDVGLDRMVNKRNETIQEPHQQELFFEKSDDFTDLFKSFNLSDRLNQDWIK